MDLKFYIYFYGQTILCSDFLLYLINMYVFLSHHNPCIFINYYSILQFLYPFIALLTSRSLWWEIFSVCKPEFSGHLFHVELNCRSSLVVFYIHIYVYLYSTYIWKLHTYRPTAIVENEISRKLGREEMALRLFPIISLLRFALCTSLNVFPSSESLKKKKKFIYLFIF